MTVAGANAAVSLALAAVLWVVQRVIYPAFADIAPERFREWHRRYTAAIAWVVVPLMLSQAGLLLAAWRLGLGSPLLALQAVAVATAWAVTFTISVPLHHRLQAARDPDAMRRLVRTNRWRTAAWSLAALCAWW